MGTTGINPTVKLAWYLAKKRSAKFEWGRNDCNTFIVEMHDTLYNTNFLPRLWEKYDSLLSAVRFSKRNIQAPNWLTEAGYRPTLSPVRQDGEVLLEQRGSCWHAWVVLQGYAYSITPDLGITKAPVEAVDNVHVWRHHA